jgi:hypothetical protein
MSPRKKTAFEKLEAAACPSFIDDEDGGIETESDVCSECLHKRVDHCVNDDYSCVECGCERFTN